MNQSAFSLQSGDLPVIGAADGYLSNHPQQQPLFPPKPKPNPLPHPQQERMSSSQMISQHPLLSLPQPFPLPQQQSNKIGSRQLPKPPSHPFPLFWQFVAAKSLILCYLQCLFTVYIMPGTGNVSKECVVRGR